MSDGMTFDFAQGAFEANPCFRTAANYLAVARTYEADGMIGDDTFLNVLSDVQNWLDHMAEKEK